MATLSVSLPDPMKEWAEKQADGDRYRDVSDYVGDLIRRDQERAGEIARIQLLVTEGLTSGISDRSMTEVLDEARRRSGLDRAS